MKEISMKRWTLLLSAAALCLMASNQAQASFQVIRWSSGFCQIWNNDFPGVPFQTDRKAVSKKFKTIEEAWAARGKLVAAKKCW
jgi:hypothetical protein